MKTRASLAVLLLGVLLAPALHAMTGGGAPAAVPVEESPVAVRGIDPALPEQERIARLFSDMLPRTHLLRLPWDDAVAASAWTNYFNALDYDHVYFLQSDIDAFRPLQTELDDNVRVGDLTFAYAVFDRLLERVRDRVAYAEALLAQGFDLEREESYNWKRRDAPWAADTAEWNDLWRRRIKNDYVRLLVSRAIESADAAEAPPAGPEAAAEDPGTEPTDFDAALSPEEYVIKRYRQVLSILEDGDAEWVLQKYLTAFATAYDFHSEYMSPGMVEDFNIEMRLSLVGIGALLRPDDGAALVVSLIPGGPAELGGDLQPGDRIIAVAQGDEPPVDTLHWPLYRVVRLIRGEKDTRVVLTVIPASDPGGATTRRITIVRDKVKLDAQAADSDIRTVEDPAGAPHRLGIIRLPAFYASMDQRNPRSADYRSATDDVAEILRSFATNAVDAVLLDLRNNGGGSLVEAIRMTGLFIKTGPTVQVREGNSLRVLPDLDPTVAYAGPLVVLVNRLSASASEILAGALQDYGRAVIVGGRQTHGKGTVQTVAPLGRTDRYGRLRVTTASYYRISGGSTQLRGVRPDILIPSPFDDMDIGEDSLPNAIPWSAVMPAAYTPVADLAEPIAGLRARSEARRAADPRFSGYRQMLDRIRDYNENADVPLNYESRLQRARTEKELADMQEQLVRAEEGTDREEAGRADLMLDEALRILADFAASPPPPPVVPPAPARTESTILKSIEAWLFNRP